MVCSSVPAAAAAGVETLGRGGNAIDAAIATAAALCVVEPMSTGLGGDAFALLWSASEEKLIGLNGSGGAPAAASLDAYGERGLERIPPVGILSATVPGAVRAWETLSERCGSLPLADVLEPAIRLADEGFPVTEVVAHYWSLLSNLGCLRNDAARATWLPGGEAPAAGSIFRCPDIAATLRAIAKGGAGEFYEGEAGAAIVATSRAEGGFFAPGDLAEHRSQWVDPISTTYRGIEVAELPPNGQGLTALIALNILENFEMEGPASELDWHRRVEAIKIAFADRNAYIADPDCAPVPVAELLSKDYARDRARAIGEHAIAAPGPGLHAGDTVYLCAADEEGNLVSFIQSVYMGFGSGVGCGKTGVVLQNRGAGFQLDPRHPNCLAPRKRPFHTIIPGMLLRDGAPWMAFGLMGGDVQPQSHLNFVSNLLDHGLNPQEAIDRPRFRYSSDKKVHLESPELPVAGGRTLGAALEARGHEVLESGEALVDLYGGGQAVACEEGVMIGASDRRKDGCAMGLFS